MLFECGKEYNLTCSFEVKGFQSSSNDYDPVPPIMDPLEKHNFLSLPCMIHILFPVSQMCLVITCAKAGGGS
jgi:hypothetical protein